MISSLSSNLLDLDDLPLRDDSAHWTVDGLMDDNQLLMSVLTSETRVKDRSDILLIIKWDAERSRSMRLYD